LFLGAQAGAAQEALSPAGTAEPSETRTPRLVLRISGELLNGLVNKQVDFEIPYRDVVLGSHVSGTARVAGQPRVELASSPDQARFHIVLTGTVHSRSVGQAGPAIIHGHAITHFQATKEIVFEPGRGFFGHPPQVAAETQCLLDGVQSKRRGILGQLVMRKAAREFADEQTEITAIAKERAARRIAQVLERHMSRRLAQLNEIVQTSAQIVDAGENAPRMRIYCRTTPSHVEIAVGRDKSLSPIQLPTLAADEAGSLIEIWIHDSLLPQPVSDAVTTLFTDPDQSAVLSALTLAPGNFGRDARAAINTLVSENKVAVRDLADWTVVELNVLPASNTFAARTLRR